MEPATERIQYCVSLLISLIYFMDEWANSHYFLDGGRGVGILLSGGDRNDYVQCEYYWSYIPSIFGEW